MSAFFVSEEHINVLVSAAISFAVSAKLEAGERRIQVTARNAKEFGLMLWRQNAISVLYRYRHHEDAPEDFENFAANIAAYRFRPDRPGSLAAVAKLAACLEYQSCETDDYEKTVAYAFLCDLRDALCRHLTGYDEAPWSI